MKPKTRGACSKCFLTFSRQILLSHNDFCPNKNALSSISKEEKVFRANGAI